MANETNSGAVTLYLDKELVKLGKAYAKANPKEQSLSAMLERLAIQHLSGKVRRYGLRMPEHLVKR